MQNKEVLFKLTFMKKIYFSLLLLIAVCTIGIIGCRKNQEAGKETGATVLTAESLSKDESFVNLNKAISRFDPQYLILVYKDKRSVKEITERSNELLTQLSTSPENMVYQKQLADFYHFASIDQLKHYSATITESLRKIDAKYSFQKTLFTGTGGQLYFKARGIYAKDQVDALQNADKDVRTNGLWLDLVESELSSFESYNTMVYDESLEEAGEGGGIDICTGEKCCYARTICLSEARKTFFQNLASYAGKAAVVLGGAAAATTGAAVASSGAGPWATFLATVGAALIGGTAGGSTGASIAYLIYEVDKDMCKTKYQICITSSNTK